MKNRTIILAASVVSALLVAVLVAVIVLVSTINKQADDQAFRDCMARYGYAVDEPPSGVTDDNLDAYINDMANSADRCSD